MSQKLKTWIGKLEVLYERLLSENLPDEMSQIRMMTQSSWTPVRPDFAIRRVTIAVAAIQG